MKALGELMRGWSVSIGDSECPCDLEAAVTCCHYVSSPIWESSVLFRNGFMECSSLFGICHITHPSLIVILIKFIYNKLYTGKKKENIFHRRLGHPAVWIFGHLVRFFLLMCCGLLGSKLVCE